MYVKNFEGDSLEEALKAVKYELGPDAIILKTKNNKGVRGAFKKAKFEITAAISEENYLKKSKVDKVLPQEHKDKLYQAPSRYINQAINEYDKTSNPTKKIENYGKLSLNKSALTTKKQEEIGHTMNELDQFLGNSSKQPQRNPVRTPSNPQRNNTELTHVPAEPANENQDLWQERNDLKRKLKLQETKIDQLEEKLYTLSQNIEKQRKNNFRGLNQLANTLRSIEIDEKIIQRVLRKAQFELSDENLANADTVFEFGLREIHESIETKMPTYSQSDVSDQPVITFLASESSTGQSSTCRKLAALQNDAVIIQFDKNFKAEQASLVDNFFDLPVHKVSHISEVITLCRKNYVEQKRIFIDYKSSSNIMGDTKKLIDLLKRSFENLEILLNVSAIHSENYNQKIISKYREVSNGLIITHMDLCLNFGQILNLHLTNKSLPLTFYCTGEVVPDDIESATSERLLGALFNL